MPRPFPRTAIPKPITDASFLFLSLAYSELRLILAKVLYHFDLSFVPGSEGWDKQKTFFLWEKNDLLVRLRPRVVAA
jgi:hypothetical protein